MLFTPAEVFCPCLVEKEMMSTDSNSEEAIASNEDLIREILSRIPVKQLMKFKSVSKGWLCLISNHRFSCLYTLRNPTSIISGLFLRRTPTEFQFLSIGAYSSNKPLFYQLNFACDPAGIKILQSCNGLLLCSSLWKLGTKRNYYVYNPTTSNFLILPSFIDDVKTTAFGVNLAFQPSKSLYYKVICVRSTEKSVNHYQIDIYESEFGAWRRSGSPFIAPFDMVFDNGVFWNGAIHWISPRGASCYFDLTNECLQKMPNPPASGTRGQRRFRYFGECGGHLHLIEIYGARSTRFKVFEMEKDYSYWFVKYEIDLDALITAYPVMVRSFLDSGDSNYYAFVPLFLVRDQNEANASLLLHIPGKIISYNVRDKTFKPLSELVSMDAGTEEASLQIGWLDAYPYNATLAPVS